MAKRVPSQKVLAAFLRAARRAVPTAARRQEIKAIGISLESGPEPMFVMALVAEPALARAEDLTLPAEWFDPALGQIASMIWHTQGRLPRKRLQAILEGTEAGRRLKDLLPKIREFNKLGELIDWHIVARTTAEELKRLFSLRKKRS